MLNPVRRWHHAVVASMVAVLPVLVLLGVAGDGNHPERFDAKLVVVSPTGEFGVRIREVVDQDFGNSSRHGYQRIIPDDFGTATDVEASSPDAPDDVSVTDLGFDTRIRIGDPDVTVSGQHRYVLEYTLPDAGLLAGENWSLDVIGTDETMETRRFEVVVVGVALTDPTCSVGGAGASGGCTLTKEGRAYRVVFEPLHPGQGITIGGHVASVGEPVAVPDPPVPPRRTDPSPLPLALVCLALGVATWLGTHRLMRRAGRNVVGGTGAADAAFGGASTRLVTDEELEALATTEFEPPRGLRPWHGAILLRERLDDHTVGAWFADQIAQGAIELRDAGKTLVAGPALSTAPPVTKARVERLLDGQPGLALGSYQPRLKTLWKEVHDEQRVAVRETGWWAKHPPGSTSVVSILLTLLVVVLFFAGFGWLAALRHYPVAVAIGSVLFPLAVAAAVYRPLLPSRSAEGSAAALRAESFRRFLEASEGRHVEWAWEHGLLREYTAWAVALGAADAWGRAIASSTVPPAELGMATMPLFLHTDASAWRTAHTAPSSSGGSGGGGGFSVGGGGGGGSSGSW